MPFWTIFWLIVPAVVLLAFTTIFYLCTAKLDEDDSEGDPPR
jgi:hypothetical protein